MAVAYVPAFLEDRATFAKERANGLYGPLSFMTANFLVGIPFLCKSLHCDIDIPLTNIFKSRHFACVFSDHLLADQSQIWRRHILHLRNVALPRSRGCRIARRARILHLPQLHCRPYFGSIRKRPVDVRERLSRTHANSQCVLAIRVPLH